MSFLSKTLLGFLGTWKVGSCDGTKGFVFCGSIVSFEVVPVQVLSLKSELLLTTYCVVCMFQLC